MTAINPQDPVVQMLKQVVDQFQSKVDELTDAMEAMMQGTGAAINNLNARIAQLEQQVNKPVRNDEEGREL